MNLNDNWQNKLGIKYSALGISIAVTNLIKSQFLILKKTFAVWVL